MNRWKAATISLAIVLLGSTYSDRVLVAQKRHNAHITTIGGRLVAGNAPNLDVASGYDLPTGEVKGFSCVTVTLKDFNGTIVNGVPQCYILTQ